MKGCGREARCRSMGQAGETMSKKKEEIKCEKCIFRARPGTGGKPSYKCEFILLTGKMRGCDVENCTRFMEATPELEKYVESFQQARAKNLEVWPLAFLIEDGAPEQVGTQKQKPKKKQKKALSLEDLEALRLRDEEKAQKRREQCRRYYESHRQQMRDKKKEWYRNNRERALEYDKAYRAKKKEEVSGKSEV